MIKVWTDATKAGLLDHSGERGSTFLYLPDTHAKRAVSVTMPVRLSSWNMAFSLPPVVEMNLPEGALRERLRLSFAKATGTFDNFDLLGIVGRSQMGRIRFTGGSEQLGQDVPFQSVDEILAARRGGDLLRHLIDKFASYSGISGIQPKILIRDEAIFGVSSKTEGRLSQSYRGATHIVKFWDGQEYPQLAANEFFCLKAAQRCGLDVPTYRLADDGTALVIDRFDLRIDGTYRGLEDFCVLNGKHSDHKYSGSYETSILRRFQEFALSPHVSEDSERLFLLIALNCAVRNGDAHLKNFAIVYDEVLGESRLSPVYDIVTTTVYLPQDQMALTLNGSTRWPGGKELQRLAETRADCTPGRARHLLSGVVDAVKQTTADVREYMRDHPDFVDIGTRMLTEWESGTAFIRPA